MLERHPFHSLRATYVASANAKRAGFEPQSPVQNRILAALPPDALERLLPHLKPVSLPLGLSIYDAGDREEHLYFLTAGIAVRFRVTENGSAAEFAVTGSEGVIGIASFLGGGSMPSQAVMLSAGHGYRLAARVLKGEFEHVGPLPHLLLRYTQALIAQTAQTAVCNRLHTLEQQLCRWILSCLDRLPSSELAMTQETIAAMLGVRREGVTKAAANLQRAGLIHCGRGHIAVLDRGRLEARACECYGVVKREYDRLQPLHRHDDVPSWN